jgi:hypothetical protein
MRCRGPIQRLVMFRARNLFGPVYQHISRSTCLANAGNYLGLTVAEPPPAMSPELEFLDFQHSNASVLSISLSTGAAGAPNEWTIMVVGAISTTDISSDWFINGAPKVAIADNLEIGDSFVRLRVFALPHNGGSVTVSAPGFWSLGALGAVAYKLRQTAADENSLSFDISYIPLSPSLALTGGEKVIGACLTRNDPNVMANTPKDVEATDISTADYFAAYSIANASAGVETCTISIPSAILIAFD